MRLKQRVFSKLAAILLLFSICFFSTSQIILKRCFLWNCPPSRNFSVLELDIPSKLFPEGSQVGEMGNPSELNGAIEIGHMDIFWHQGDGAAHYTIWRFGTESQSSILFKKTIEMEQEFGLTTCSEINLTLSASEYYISCGYHKFGGYRADVNARYQEYLIAFNTTIDKNMSFEKFEEIVLYIDKQINQKISSK